MKHPLIVKLTLLIALLPLPVAALQAADGPKPSRKPNFIVILIDDMGYGDIAPFGSKLNRTPNLDRMAKEGMKLTSFYAAPLCSASRAQMMTGCYAKRVGIPDVVFPVRGVGLSAEEKTVAGLLKLQGYTTMCIGKWHLGDQPEFLPTRHGFDHFIGLPYSNNMDGTGENPGTKNFMPPLPLMRDEKVIEAPPDQTKLTRLFTDEAVKFITVNKDRPFFLYFPHIAVHGPLRPGIEFSGKSKNGDYGDWVEEVDWSVGRVIDTLKQLKLAENTIVLFTSDNGGTGKGYSNAPLRGKKGSTWEGGQREPTIAWGPGRIAAGSVSDAVTSGLDVLPTFVRLAGGKVPTDRKIDGVDIWPVLSGQSKSSSREALYYFLWGSLEAVRSGPWKLAIADQKDAGGNGESPGADSEKGSAAKKKKGAKDQAPVTASTAAPRLYNLDADIGETKDVAAQHPDVVKRLQKLIDLMAADLGMEKTNNKNRTPGVRAAGQVNDPVPLLKQ
ncbi:MAG: sulfatase [Pirellulaceae bacterium]|nr:sulfatase [Pirellulaceae bacterium]